MWNVIVSNSAIYVYLAVVTIALTEGIILSLLKQSSNQKPTANRS